MFKIFAIFFVSAFVFFVGCIVASVVYEEIKLFKINRKIKKLRDEDVNLKTEKIRKIDNE